MSTEKNNSNLVTRIDDRTLEYDTNTLQAGESIQCPDDKDTTVIKNDDGTVTIQKKCFSKKCFY